MITPAECLGWARTIADQLCDEAIRSGGRATWLGDTKEQVNGTWEVVHRSVDGELYGGTAGIGLFLLRIGLAAGEERYCDTAREALAHAADWTARARPRGSFYEGTTGVAAVLAEAGERLGDAALAEQALCITRAALGEAPVEGSDVLAGRAGSIVALLHLARSLRHEPALDAARALGEALVREASHTPYSGASWASDVGVHEPPLCGLSHGASGIAWALDELTAATGDQRFRQCAAAAADYERAWFARQEGNWPDLREWTRNKLARGERPAFPAFWCHGAVGIGLVRLRQLELTGDLIDAAEAEASILTAERQLAQAAESPKLDVSLCHGLAGTAELFLEGARVLHQPLLREKALVCAQLAVLSRGEGNDPWPCGVPDGGENPSLMLGLAGIGMLFLRAADVGAAPVGLLYTAPIVVPRVIVQLDDVESERQLAARAAELAQHVAGSRVERVSRGGRVLLRLPAGVDVEQAARTLSALQGVRYAEPDVKDHQTDG